MLDPDGVGVQIELKRRSVVSDGVAAQLLTASRPPSRSGVVEVEKRMLRALDERELQDVLATLVAISAGRCVFRNAQVGLGQKRRRASLRRSALATWYLIRRTPTLRLE